MRLHLAALIVAALAGAVACTRVVELDPTNDGGTTDGAPGDAFGPRDGGPPFDGFVPGDGALDGFPDGGVPADGDAITDA